MTYKKHSQQSLDQLDARLREAAARHKFGVLHVHDLEQTLKSKGIDLGPAPALIRRGQDTPTVLAQASLQVRSSREYLPPLDVRTRLGITPRKNSRRVIVSGRP
jgi:hypothetical protein